MNINKITLYVTLPLFALILVAVFLIPSQYLDKEVQKIFIEKNIIKDVLTIFLLTSTIILLGLSNVINGEIIGTLFGGISVYVLQRGLENKLNGNDPKNLNAPKEPNTPKKPENDSNEQEDKPKKVEGNSDNKESNT